jgi:hypothetical protein
MDEGGDQVGPSDAAGPPIPAPPAHVEQHHVGDTLWVAGEPYVIVTRTPRAEGPKITLRPAGPED